MSKQIAVATVIEPNLAEILQILNPPTEFRVSFIQGLKHGLTEFFDKKGNVHAAYAYVEDQCDYLESFGFDSGSMGELRQKDVRKQNKKHKLTEPLKVKRFYSMEHGFYSLEDLYVRKLLNLTVSFERLESIDRKISSIKGIESRIGRWCSSGVCACLGCANHLLGWTREEHASYLLYKRAKAFGITMPKQTGE